MKQFLALCLAMISCVIMAQQQPTGTLTSPNLVYSTVNPWNGPAGSTSPGTWSGFTVTQSTGGGLSGGSQPGYNVEQGKFLFGYAQGTVGYNYAVSTALKNSGMTWLGYNYSWEYINQDFTRGTLSANVAFNSTTGTQLHSKSWTLGPTTEGWTAVSGTEVFTTPAAVANVNSFTLSVTGRDDRFWAGYYGPQFRNPSIRVNYTFDACYSNPLSSPDCPGYQQALLDQQCTANPLYSTACPGYAAAYQTQQCTVNPLYSPQCPGYQTAYFNQQCTANPLYATTCPGYADAYKTQQCSLNALYATDCPGYATAYKTQQCTADPLYAKDCPGYDQAYLNAQCIKDSLYSRLCTGYATAYAIKYLVPLDSTTSSAVNSSLSTTASVKASDPTSVNTTGSVSTTGNTTVDSVITAPSTTSTTSVTSVNSVVAPPPPPPGAAPQAPTARAVDQATAPPPPPPPARQSERAADARRTEGAVAAVEKRAEGDPERAKREATDRAKQLAVISGNAATLEAQAATQGLVVGLMNYVPGFSAYQNAIVPDVLGAAVARQYHKPTTDNRSAQRQLSGSNEIRWREMVDSQYK